MALLVLSFILVASPVMAAPIVTISIPEPEPDKPGVFATVTLTAPTGTDSSTIDFFASNVTLTDPPSGVTIHLPDGNIGDPNGITISDQVSFTVTTLPIKITYTFTSGGDVPGGLGLCASGVGGCGLIESDAFQIFSTIQFRDASGTLLASATIQFRGVDAGVPEPASLLLLVVGVAAVAGTTWTARRRS